jgi:peptidyl-tRNA hydrolase
MKQYIIIRSDKRVPIGKIVAHVGHNVLTNYLTGRFERVMTSRQHEWYYYYAQTKIVVKANINQIKDIQMMAEGEDIGFSFIRDINYKYPICAVVGPVTDDEAKLMGLKNLDLYKG